jgi:hypothetical protein
MGTLLPLARFEETQWETIEALAISRKHGRWQSVAVHFHRQVAPCWESFIGITLTDLASARTEDSSPSRRLFSLERGAE